MWKNLIGIVFFIICSVWSRVFQPQHYGPVSWVFFGGLPEHCRRFSTITGLHPVGASSTPLVLTNTHLQLLPDVPWITKLLPG